MTLSDVLVYEITAIIGLTAVMILYKLVTRQINARGMLGNGSSPITASRVQSLIGTVTVGFMYLRTFPMYPGEMPPVTPDMLAILGGSQAIYLGGKVSGLLGWFGNASLK
jgi:hypothetical protein